MEDSERETHDFMKVDSFSQLPFIRPAPVKEKGIRLFGIEFNSNKASTTIEDPEETQLETNKTIRETAEGDSTANNRNNRRFECHYCCRNFPTSQALGGHQNAHKRERQHAKRAHLQSSMAIHGGVADYGSFMSYRSSNYPSWNTHQLHSSSSDHNFRFYGSHGSNSFSSLQQPINGSPLGLWTIPNSVQGNNTSFYAGRDRSVKPSTLLPGEKLKASQVIGGGGGGSSSQGRYGNLERKGSVQDYRIKEVSASAFPSRPWHFW